MASFGLESGLPRARPASSHRPQQTLRIPIITAPRPTRSGATVLLDVPMDFAQPVPLTEQRQQKPGAGYTYTHAGHTHDGNEEVEADPHKHPSKRTRTANAHCTAICISCREEETHGRDLGPSAGVRTIRVFVSSTFKDGHAERDAVPVNHSAVPRLRLALAGRGLFLNVVVLRWGIAEGAAESGDVPEGGPEEAYPHACVTELEILLGAFVDPAGREREARLSREAFASARRRVYVHRCRVPSPPWTCLLVTGPSGTGKSAGRAGTPRDALILHFVGGSARSARLSNLVQYPPPASSTRWGGCERRRPPAAAGFVADTPKPEAANGPADPYEDLGEYGRAARLYGEALQARERGRGGASSQVAETLHDTARLHFKRPSPSSGGPSACARRRSGRRTRTSRRRCWRWRSAWRPSPSSYPSL
eukprot:tig00021070_g17854.t1